MALQVLRGSKLAAVKRIAALPFAIMINFSSILLVFIGLFIVAKAPANVFFMLPADGSL